MKGYKDMANGVYRRILEYFGFVKTKPIILQKTSLLEKENVTVNKIQWDSSKERLTDEKVRNYLGTNYEGAMYYNFDDMMWKSDKCLGYVMPYQDNHEKMLWSLKAVLEQEVKFSGFELVAVVTMAVKDRFFPGVGEKVSHPFFARSGTGVVGTIIRRDRKTGKLLPLPCNWNGVRLSKLGVCDAIWYGPKWFALAGIENADFRNSLIKNHARTR